MSGEAFVAGGINGWSGSLRQKLRPDVSRPAGVSLNEILVRPTEQVL